MGRKVAAHFLPTYLLVLSMIEDGHTLAAIARTLNREGVPTSRGARWYPSTIKGIRDSQTAQTVTETPKP